MLPWGLVVEISHYLPPAGSDPWSRVSSLPRASLSRCFLWNCVVSFLFPSRLAVTVTLWGWGAEAAPGSGWRQNIPGGWCSRSQCRRAGIPTPYSPLLPVTPPPPPTHINSCSLQSQAHRKGLALIVVSNGCVRSLCF